MTQVDIIRLAEGPLSLEIAPKIGGSILSFTVDGMELMRTPSPATIAERGARAMACYPMAPFSNRLRDAVLHFAGRRFELVRAYRDGAHALHGNAWQHAWEVEEAGKNAAQIVFQHSSEGDGALEWPFTYEVTQEFRLLPEALAVRMRLVNRDIRPAPAGFGLHPFFPHARSAKLGFKAASVGAAQAARLPLQQVAIPARWNFATPHAVAGTGLDHCFAGWDGQARIEWPQHGLALDISADSVFGHLVVFTPEGRDDFAVEPVSHDVDAFNRAEAGAQGTGMRLLAPGEAIAGTMRFKFRRV